MTPLTQGEHDFLLAVGIVFLLAFWWITELVIMADKAPMYDENENPIPCPHGFKDWDDCPMCRH